MNDTSPQILILGGGVAGLSAALALKDQDVAVHLVERSDRLGGHADTWACMATSACQNCGACLVQEMAGQVRTQANARIYLNTQVTALEKDPMVATLSNGQTLVLDRIILATGFSPFDPASIPSLHAAESPKVITTARLNTLIKEETLAALGDSPRIAFLQCIGSRDRNKGRDYCSQVCCKISMRHAKKLLHLLPGAEISLFYMDLQVMGKEARQAAQDLSGRVALIQGVPAEILENPATGAMTLVTEDGASGARKAADFDLVVLSVGMTPAQDHEKTAAILGIQANAWGFFNTREPGLPPGIIPAGCAKGPKDIPTACQEGRIAAARAVQALKGGDCPGIAILGDGEAALAAASAAARLGYPAFCLGCHTTLPQGVQDFSTAKILAVDGYNGQFSIFMEKEGKKQTLSCGAIIAAPLPETGMGPETPAWPGALLLEEFSKTLPQDLPQTIAVALDLLGPENKADSRKALRAALEARKAGKSVFVLMNQMLVHGPTGQQEYDAARKAGVRFLRWEKARDLDIRSQGSRFAITLKEATLGGRQVCLGADCLVVSQGRHPAPGFRDLAARLKVDLDQEGFLQSPNVRHRLVQSPRKGIFFAGPGHDETDDQDLAAELDAIMADLELGRRASALAGNMVGNVTGPLVINEKKCAKCLTCFRVCPHRAIILNEKQRPQIMPQACFACQSCVSNCPAYAIESEGFTNAAMVARAAQGRTLILACERSGALAAQTLPDHADLVPIPCACRISADMLIKALLSGAQKVIVSACHQGNCRSVHGSSQARGEVARVAALPGLAREKIAFQTVAANEPKTFARLISKA